MSAECAPSTHTDQLTALWELAIADGDCALANTLAQTQVELRTNARNAVATTEVND